MQFCNHKMTRLFSALLIAFIVMSGMGSPVSARPELTDIVQVSFVGGGSVHLTFGSSDGNPSALNLKVQVNGAYFTTLNIPMGTASYRVTGLQLNSVVTFINSANGSTLASTDTSSLEGTMLYDEVIDTMTLTAHADESSR